ncbi:MAG: type III polyketide synthase, partial [Bacteroidota bacterium]
MSVTIVNVEKELPEYFRETKDILPLVESWLGDKDERFRRKITKIFEGAAVDKRYSIMSPEEVFVS